MEKHRPEAAVNLENGISATKWGDIEGIKAITN
jgi:hypothetical protein